LLTLSSRLRLFLPKWADIFSMYFEVTDHWHYMKEESARKGDNLEITIEEAFVDYVRNYGRFTWVSNIVPRSYLWGM
jgi:hypothetical protein